jgi:hypothetical protein
LRVLEKVGWLLLTLGVGELGTHTAWRSQYVHDGFYLRGGLTLGRGWLWGDSKHSQSSLPLRAHGVMPGALVLVGGTVRSGVVVGGGVSSHCMLSPHGRMLGYVFDDDPEFRVCSNEVLFFSDYYFDRGEGFHVLGSLGLSPVTLRSPNYRYQLTIDGLSLRIGAGYEVWAGPELSFGPLLLFQYAGLLGSGEGYDHSGSLLTVSAALALTYH